MFSKLKIIPFLLISILIATKSTKSEMKLSATESNHTLVTTITGKELVTSKTYKAYETDEWLLTLGGGEGYIGMDTFSASKATLGNWAHLMGWDTKFNSTTKYVTALISKVSMNDITSISISRSGTSYFNYANVCAYLVVSDSLDKDYALLAEITSISTTPSTYNIEPYANEKYYAIVFYNPNGVFALGGVTLSFYSINQYQYRNVRHPSDLIFGAQYVVKDDASNILDRVLIGIGAETQSYTLYSVKDNSYISVNNQNQINNFTFDFDLALVIRENSSQKFLMFDANKKEFMLGEATNFLLYLDESSIDYDLEAKLFVHFVLQNSENASGRCNEVFEIIQNVYDRLSENGKRILNNSSDNNIILVKERMAYLANIANNQILKSNLGFGQNYKPAYAHLLCFFSTFLIVIYIYKKTQIKP